MIPYTLSIVRYNDRDIADHLDWTDHVNYIVIILAASSCNQTRDQVAYNQLSWVE